MKRNQEQINKPIKLYPTEHQAYRNKLYFEEELRKVVPDLIRAERYGYLSKDGINTFDYYTSGEPDVRHSAYFILKNGLIEFTGILEGKVQKYPVNNSGNNY